MAGGTASHFLALTATEADFLTAIFTPAPANKSNITMQSNNRLNCLPLDIQTALDYALTDDGPRKGQRNEASHCVNGLIGYKVTSGVRCFLCDCKIPGRYEEPSVGMRYVLFLSSRSDMHIEHIVLQSTG